MSDAANSPLDPNALEAPACRAGGLIIFDYRTIHRGLANEGERERPIAYFVCATGGATDAHNFPEGGIADATPAEAAAFPFGMRRASCERRTTSTTTRRSRATHLRSPQRSRLAGWARSHTHGGRLERATDACRSACFPTVPLLAVSFLVAK